MATTSGTDDLTQAIHRLVYDSIARTKTAVLSAVEQAFGHHPTLQVSTRRRPGEHKQRRTRRSRQDILELAQRLLDAVVADPGQTMPVLAARLGVVSCEAQRSLGILKNAGHLRTAGERRRTRYYPTASGSKRPALT